MLPYSSATDESFFWEIQQSLLYSHRDPEKDRRSDNFFGIFLGVVATNVFRNANSHGWVYKFWPLISFSFVAVGGVIGAAGMIGTAFQRRRKNSN